MDIQGHLIKDSEIIGIGPLMNIQSESQIGKIYNSRKLFYDIHLKERSISIESNYLNIGYDKASTEEEQAREKWYEFIKDYSGVKKVIEGLINPIKNDLNKVLNEQKNQTHEK